MNNNHINNSVNDEVSDIFNNYDEKKIISFKETLNSQIYANNCESGNDHYITEQEENNYSQEIHNSSLTNDNISNCISKMVGELYTDSKEYEYYFNILMKTYLMCNNKQYI